MPPASLIQISIPTGDGEFMAGYSAKGLTALDFPSGRAAKLKPRNDAVPAPVWVWHRVTTAALQRILAGRPPGSFPPLDLSSGTEFQQRVWNALRRIKAGQTRTYGEIASEIGRPNAVRAVGGACGANPIPVLIPCHRVLAASQKIGGFSGGLGWKRTLLKREGVQPQG